MVHLMSTLKEYSIAVVVPMHNEAENVASLVNEIITTLRGQINFSLIIVDDGSTDQTFQCLQSMCQTIKELQVVKHRRNYGQSAGVVTGVRAAKHEWIVTLDGDGQNHPGDILQMVAILVEHKDNPQPILVAGNRGIRNDTAIRKLSSRIANGVRSRLLQDNCPDSGCGIKAFRRTDFLNLPYFNHLHRFLPALFKRNNGLVINVIVQHRPRTQGYSKYGLSNRLWVGIVDLLGVGWLIRRPCYPEIEDVKHHVMTTPLRE